jgi:flagellar biosynthesis protein
MSDPVISRQKAVALHYDGSNAPRVVAKGKGHMAEVIIATAKAHDIPLEDNPLLVEALAQVPLEEEIPENLYKAVAEILSFLFKASERAR